MSDWLNETKFIDVIDSAPLVSIDLILIHEHQVLLGKRINRPAQGFWFVPGGRVRKNEPLEEAFQRLTLAELGVELDYSQAQLLGAFDHFYSDSVFGESPSTHYVALGMYLKPSRRIERLPNDQHDSFVWWPVHDALSDPAVHKYTKLYLRKILKDY